MENVKTLDDLYVISEKHPYYSSDSNYYSNDCSENHETFDEFLEEWSDADLDMNLLFRWDLGYIQEEDSFYLQLFFIQQRKGIYFVNMIETIKEEDLPKIIEYLKTRKEHLLKLWN